MCCQRASVLPAVPGEGNEVKKFKKSIIPPAHPRGLSVLKPADENLPFMLILQICLFTAGALKCIFPVQDLTLRNVISPWDLNLLYFNGGLDKWGSKRKTSPTLLWSECTDANLEGNIDNIHQMHSCSLI